MISQYSDIIRQNSAIIACTLNMALKLSEKNIPKLSSKIKPELIEICHT